MRSIIFVFSTILLLASCKGSKPVVVQDQTIVKDSVSKVTTIVPRDTIITVPKDSLRISIPLKEITEKPQEHTSKSGRVKAYVSREADNITIECIFTELKLKLQILDKQLKIFKEQTKIRTITQEIEIPYTPWYKEALAWVGGIYLALLIGSILLKTIKP